MSKEDDLLKERHQQVYGPKVDEFFKGIEREGYTEEELAAVPELFLPACGPLYATSLVKLAVIGQETLRWGWDKEGLAANLRAWKAGKFDAQLSWRIFREEGPLEWQNRFWAYHFAVLEKVYAHPGLWDGHNAILDGIAWGNRFSVERKGAEVGDGWGNITDGRFWKCRDLAEAAGLSSFKAFCQVFEPNAILYSCLNKAMGSDSELECDAELIAERNCDRWKIRTWKMGRTWIFQTWHPSYLARWKGVSVEVFAEALRDEMMARGVFAPIGAKAHYDSDSDPAMETFAQRLEEETRRIVATEPGIDNRALSYRLLGSLALELCKQRATMTARQAGQLLNRLERFQRDGYLFAPGGHGPCKVVATAWGFFYAGGTEEDRRMAEAIAVAYTTVHGTYAYNE